MICEKKNLMLAFFGRVAGKIIAEFQYFYLHYQIYTTKHRKIAQYQMKFQKFTVFLSIYAIFFRSTYTHHFQTSEALHVKLI